MNGNILIVDDNIKNLQLAAQILKEEGYSLSLAENASDALKYLENQLPDLILLDIMMPDMDGIDLCLKIKSNITLSDIPVIFITALDDTFHLVKGFGVGAVDYITKPFQKEELKVRVKNHIELARAKKVIVSLNKDRDRLYSIIAHDLRSPLFVILNSVHFLINGNLDKNSTEYDELLNDLETVTSATGNLLKDLLNWIQSQTGNIIVQPATQQIFPVIKESLLVYEGNIKQKKINIHNSVSENQTAYFDEPTIKTVFRNLVSNALKFTPDGGNIRLSSTNKNNKLVITIEDEGVGMTEEIIQKIMKTDERLTTYGTNHEKGSGLGLVLIKDFVYKNKGNIEIQSIKNKGTSIKVSIPIYKSGYEKE